LADKLNSIRFVIIILFTAGLIITGCTPSTLNSRYYKPDRDDENDDSGEDETYVIYRDEEPANSKNDEFLEKYESLVTAGVEIPSITKMYIEIIKYMKTPYLYGGESFSGMDCSGFTMVVFERAFGIKLPRTAADQFRFDGLEIGSIDRLEIGDLVFFKITDPREPDHVGIYLGNGNFAHAGFSTGVTISSFETNYFLENFYSAKRIVSLP